MPTSFDVLTTIEDLRAWRRLAKGKLGFVPTMGYFHEGHLRLMRRAKKECDLCVVSIYVNPKQFGPKEDFKRYPRDIRRDTSMTKKENVDILFIPSDNVVYPKGYLTYIDVEKMSQTLCGHDRPGHFKGVATVVAKLLNMVQPDRMYLGQKDAQQVRILQQMAHDLNLNIEIVVCPIVREPDGLALSSRNTYLNGLERRAATVLHRALEEARRAVSTGTLDSLQLQTTIRGILSKEPLARVDYVEIADAQTFEPLVRIGARPAYVLLAVHIGKTRLIDNLLIETKNGEHEPVCSL